MIPYLSCELFRNLLIPTYVQVILLLSFLCPLILGLFQMGHGSVLFIWFNLTIFVFLKYSSLSSYCEIIHICTYFAPQSYFVLLVCFSLLSPISIFYSVFWDDWISFLNLFLLFTSLQVVHYSSGFLVATLEISAWILKII